VWKIIQLKKTGRGNQEVFYGNAYHPEPAREFFGNIKIKF